MPQPKVYASCAARQAAYRQRCQEARRQQLQEERLPAMPALPTIPGRARWRQTVANAIGLLSMVTEEMAAYFNDRSEAWQESDKGEEFCERLDALCEARDTITECALP
jgi:hypothetical protein